MAEVKFCKKDFVKEIKKQLWLAVPLFLVGLAQYAVQLISVVFVGHLGKLPLAGASLANSFSSVVGFTLLLGMSGALETLCGQSFGANEHHMVGIHMQRAMIVLSIASIFIAIIWANTEFILTSLHQDPEISHVAGDYSRAMIPSIFAFALLQCMVKFLQSQNMVMPMVVISGIATALHAPICWTLVYKTSLGYKGAAVANCITYWINVLIYTFYIKFSPSCKKSWTGFSKKAFENIYSFIKLAVPSSMMVCFDVWSFELTIILAGLLPHPKVETSVQSICLSAFALAWMIPFGMSAAVSTRTSNELGAGRQQSARLAVFVSLAMAITECTISTIVLILIRNLLGHVFTNEEDVIKGVASTIPILACASFLDGLQGVLSGIARGCGWQNFGAIINFVSFYLIGNPIGIVLAFVVHLKGKGLWLGIVSAHLIQVLGLLFITIRTNWDEEVKKAAKNLNASSINETAQV